MGYSPKGQCLNPTLRQTCRGGLVHRKWRHTVQGQSQVDTFKAHNSESLVARLDSDLLLLGANDK